jgi:uncharacterized membrane protein
MSLREKANEVKAAGERARGNWTPQGKPLELYKRWVTDRRARGKDAPTRENFCHYWRVVAIWYPLSVVRNKVVDIALHDATAPTLFIIAAIAVVVGIITGSILSREFLYMVLTVLAVLYFAIGAVVGAEASQHHAKGKKFERADKWFLAIFAPVALPVFALGWALLKVSVNTRANVALGIAGLVVLALVAWGLIGLWTAIGFWTLAILGTIALLVAALVVCVPWVTNLIAHRREVAYEKSLNRPITRVHTVPSKRKKPSVVSRFFTALGDFIILLAQVVRVNKWKICPIVEVNVDEPVDEEVFA